MTTALRNEARAERAHYAAFGLQIASDFPLARAVPLGGGAPDLWFSCDLRAPVGSPHDELSPVFASASEVAEGRSAVRLSRGTDFYLLSFTDVADYYLWEDRIVCHLLDETYRDAVEPHLFGLVLAIWFESHGSLALHASAVSLGETAVAFIGGKYAGKTTLATTLMLEAAGSWLTDDLLVLSPSAVARPANPEIRLWPDQALHFFGLESGLERVHPKSAKLRVPLAKCAGAKFCEAPVPLSAFYVPESADVETISITRVEPASALMTLVVNSYAGHLVEAMGLQAERFERLGTLAKRLPVYHLVFPRGLARLRDVAAAIIANQAA